MDGVKCDDIKYDSDAVIKHLQAKLKAAEQERDQHKEKIKYLESAWHAKTLADKDWTIAKQEEDNDRLKADLSVTKGVNEIYINTLERIAGLVGLDEDDHDVVSPVEGLISEIKALREKLMRQGEELDNLREHRNRYTALRDRDHWMRRAEIAEAQLKAAQEQDPVAYQQMTDHQWVGISKARYGELDGMGLLIRKLYAEPIPANKTIGHNCEDDGIIDRE